MENKKIAITGHTLGLGKGLYDHLEEQGHAVDGFSRSNGYDIQDKTLQTVLVSKIKDHDVFINNACAGFTQIELLYSLFQVWQKEKKLIINISSNSSDSNKSYVHPYAIQKHALDKASEQLNNISDSACRIVNIRPGWIATERIKRMKIEDPILALQDVLKIVDFILALPSSIHIPSLSVVARR